MAITSFYLSNMFPRMRTSSSSPNNQHPTPKLNMFPLMRTFTSSANNQHPSPKPNMFPRMHTLSSSPNNQYPTPKPNMFPQMRTLHHHLTINNQHPDKTCSLRCALYIITQQSTPITQAKHVPSDAHFTSSPNNHHPSPNSQTCSLGCALYIITQQSTPNTQQS